MTRTALNGRPSAANRFSFVRARMARAVHAAIAGRFAGRNQQGRPRSPVESLEGRTFLSITGAVFVGTNHNNTKDPTEPGNQVVMYNRDETGKLTIAGTYDTGGQGSGPSVRFAGDGLGSAHSVQLSKDKKFLFVANAGSDSVSVFRVSPDGLELTDVQPTGDFPNSVTQSGNKVYVLQNAGGAGAITGYTLNSSTGQLTPLAGSTRTLNANQDPDRPDTLFNPTQVSFTPSGKQLVVTIKDGPKAGAIPGVTPTGPGRVLVFNVNGSGLPSAAFKQTNLANRGPFGFSFDPQGRLLTSLFVGGPNLTGAAQSFKINGDGSLSAISGVVGNTQLDSCWIENNGKYAWTANYTSGTISTYLIGANGNLTLTQTVAASANDLPGGGGKSQGATPLDIRVSPNGQYVYNVLPGSGAVAAFRVLGTGGLVKLGEFGGLPDTVNGDSAPVEFGPGGSPAGVDVLDYATPITSPRGFAYVQTNNPTSGQNAILAYKRDPATGNLTRLAANNGVFLTGGTGYLNVDDRIGPDDSDQEVVVTKDRKFLLAVNQGSNTVTTFRIAADGSLSRVGVYDSNGKQPVSIGIVNKTTLIVVNKGDQNPGGSGGTNRPNYTTFRMAADGSLSKVLGSRIDVGPGSSPSQALVSRDGKYIFGDNFLARQFDPPAGFPADLVPPFGSELLSFRLDGNLKLQRNGPAQPSPLPGVADKFILNFQAHPTRDIVYTGFVVGNKLGVYRYNAAGVLQFQKAVPTTGAGLCWIVISPDGKRLYGTNFASDSVAVFDISDPLNPVEIQDVPLKLRNPRPANEPSPAPFDTVAFQLSIDPEGKNVYVVNHEQTLGNSSTTGNAIHVLTVGANGTLTENASSPIVLSPPLVPAASHPMGVVAI